MQGDRIPDPDHIARYCPFGRLSEKTGKPSGAAFQLRAGEPYISVNWLEYFSGLSREQQISEIRKALASKMKGGLGATAKLAIYKVKDVIEKFPSPVDAVRVLHQPENNDPSHSGIFDFDPDRDELLITLLLSQLECDMRPARSS